jgi:hypothetical protein
VSQVPNGPKTLIIAINRILSLQLIFLATNYMCYWDLMHYCYYIILLQLIFKGTIIFIIAINHNYLCLLQLKVIIAMNSNGIQSLK